MKPRMIFVFALCLLIIGTVTAVAANDAPAGSQIGQLMELKGTLFVKFFYPVTEITGHWLAGGRISLEAAVIFEPGKEAERLRGLRVEVMESGKEAITRAAFLDLDEIQSASRAVGYMLEMAKEWEGKKRDYSEVAFTTKDNFRIVFWQNGKEQRAAITCGLISPAKVYLANVQMLEQLRNGFDKALTVLETK